MSKRVLASLYYDKIGIGGKRFNDGGLYYFELSNDYKKKDFSALGNLPIGTKLKILYKGKSCVATKADVGVGGPNNAKIELHVNLAKKLGFDMNKGLDYVIIERV